MTSADGFAQRLLKDDRLVALSGIGAITLVAWVYLIAAAAEPGMIRGEILMMADLRPWTAVEGLAMFTMWSVMMVAMMVPSATPVILLYARILRDRHDQGRSFAPALSFLSGYVTIWLVFSLVMTVFQWGLEQAALLSPMMSSASPTFTGLILVAAGLYQGLPVKNACLSRCRSPMESLFAHWRKGASGAFRMGVGHGVYCVGCCWALMLLLFVGGVMNLLWVAAISGVVLAEKVTPFGRVASRVGALVLAIGGMVLISASSGG